MATKALLTQQIWHSPPQEHKVLSLQCQKIVGTDVPPRQTLRTSMGEFFFSGKAIKPVLRGNSTGN